MKTVLRIQLLPIVAIACLLCAVAAGAQSTVDLAELVHRLKSDSRGPFKGIAWFCPDGTVLPASQRCPEPGGIQRGVYKDVVVQVEKQGIYLGQILSGQERVSFLDKSHDFSRARQYEIETYLRRIDDGWVMRLARQYRGAINAADEEAWGGDFLKWLLNDDAFVASHFYWARELVRDVPHSRDEQRSAEIRELSDRLATGMPDFMPIAVKIHSQPDSTDLQAVRDFHSELGSSVPAAAESVLVPLENELEWKYQTLTMKNLSEHYRARLPDNARIYRMLESLARTSENDARVSCDALTEILTAVQERLQVVSTGGARLPLMDLSLSLEELLLRVANEWRAGTVGELIGKCAVLARASAACGYVRSAEWADLAPALDATSLGGSESLVELWNRIVAGRGLIDDAVALQIEVFGTTVDVFSEFEPLTAHFFDDRTVATILLPFGDTVGKLAQQFAARADIQQEIVDVDSTTSVRGLNPGVAVGELVVVYGRADNFAFEKDNIYVLENAPTSLPRVAGLLSVNEGNPVLEPQRMASQTGMPNAAISMRDLRALNDQSGRLVFFAVSPGGRVVMKSTWDMTPEERQLFASENPAPVSTYLESLDPEINRDVTIGMAEPVE